MKTSNNILKNESGATIIYVAVIIAMLVMFTALAVDIGYLYGVRNELQDAADAGALAGATVLFDSEHNCDLRAAEAIAEATRVTQLNKTGNTSIIAKTVNVGHWSFHTPDPDGHVFTANLDVNPVQIEWKEQSASQLDADPAYINAVRVVTERTDTPSFFARIFGFNNFLITTRAVAYRGFSGGFNKGDFDQPIAICEQSITDDAGNLECNMGRMINSGNDSASSNTGAWTNFTQPCDTANRPTVNPLICGTGNTNEPRAGEGIGTTGGEVQNLFEDMMACWIAATNKTKNWPLTLPVVDCPGNNVSNCATLKGAVTLDVIWMIDNISQGQNKFQDVPRYMEIWGFDANNNPILLDTYDNPTSVEPDNFEAWKDFVDYFKLANVNGLPASNAEYDEMYQHKNIFFRPKCQYTKGFGGTGGQNFGVCARSPVLVQ